jgi:ABC-type dipeptide/oligopeptide/nickel transport system ATPase component
MRSSLPSRETIADSVELTIRGHSYDALIGLAGCDKSLPGMMMAMLRLNVPSIFIYGGSILPGNFRGQQVTVQDMFEAVGKHSVGEMSDEDLDEIERVACPSAAPAVPSSPPTPWRRSRRPSGWLCRIRPERLRLTKSATASAWRRAKRSWS